MSPKLSKAVIPAFLAFLLIACGTPVIKNVDNAPIVASNPNYDLSEVTNAIQQAGISKGWQMKEETPGHMVATLYIRSHVARVDITYTLDDYSITYKDSTNLKFDPVKNTIHGRYNSWVQNLKNAIDAQLSAL